MKSITPNNSPVLPKLRIFNPSRLTDAELEASFIVRQQLFEKLLQQILNEKKSHVPQHHLIIGQRGMGKTTLLCRIGAELRKAEYVDQYIPLQFPEEQYVEVNCLSKFWLNCLDSLADALEEEGDSAAVKDLDQRIRLLDRSGLGEVELADAGQGLFIEMIKVLKRRPILLFDNFHLLLDRLKESDYTLRAFFMKEGAPILVGGSTAMPSDTDDYGAAFYDGFMIHLLHRLSLREMQDVLKHLAELSGNANLAARIYEETPRLATLRDLTGGNPRTTVLMFELFARGFSEDAYEDLEGLLDYITPLYQSRLDQLPEQAQLVFGALARNWAPATAIQLTELTGVVRGSISTQLNRLESFGLVEKVELSKGKKPGYQVAERFFNIWYLMRFAARRQRSGLICLTKFLQEFHTPDELVLRARGLMERDALSAGELTYAMALAEAGLGTSTAYELRTYAETLAVRNCDGKHDEIASIIDPADISARVYTFEETRCKLRQVAKKRGGNVDLDEFVDLVISSIHLLPPYVNSRLAIADGDFSAEEVESLFEKLKETRELMKKGCGEAALTYLEDRLRRGLLTRLDDREELEHALEACSDVRACNLLARLLNPSPELAVIAYERITRIDPRHFEAWFELGNIFQYSLRKYENSEKAYRAALKINDQSSYLYNDLGNLIKDYQGRYQESEACYRRAIELDAGFAWPWGNLGLLLQEQSEHYEEAEEAYRRAIQIDPKYANAWNNLGALIDDEFERVDEALKCFEKATELAPKSALHWRNLAKILHHKLNRIEGAEVAYRKSIELDSDYVAPVIGLGDLLQYKLKRYDEAEVLYRKVIELDDTRVGPWNGLGDLYLSQARLDDANQAYLKAVEVDPKFSYAYKQLAILNADRFHDYEEAERLLRKYLEINPDVSSIWNTLGNLLLDFQGKIDAAETSYLKAFEINEKNACALHNLAFLYRDFHDNPQKAKEVLAKIVEPDEDLADSEELQEVLFASRLQNWGDVELRLAKALDLAEGEFSSTTIDDWHRAAAVLLHQGYGSKLVSCLEDRNLDVEKMPWVEAIRAHVQESRRYLLDIPQESREVAGQIYDQIAIRRKWLPESTKNLC